MGNALQITPLPHLGLIRLRGADGGKFLQGQLSNDLARLAPERSLLAGYHNPQGRVIALLRLLHWDQDDVLAILPRELAATVSARLAKFILRSRVKLGDESADWQVLGISASSALPGLPAASNSQTRPGDVAFVCVNDTPSRWLAVAPAGAEVALPGEAQAGDPADWVRLEVAAGQPQVVNATSEQFVAQMLNLDRLEAIAFDKGCYTGQEVIARAHYRGRVKRRMQRFISREACSLAPGDAGQLADGRPFKVVLAASLPDGRADFLAVTALPGAGQEETQSDTAAALATTANNPAEPAAAVLAADAAALPYSLPD